MGVSFRFGEFRLDADREQLFLGDECIALRPKTFGVLRHLVENPDRLVSKEELFDTFWADTAVSDPLPAISVREIRRALRDETRPYRFVETVYSRGFRFVAEVRKEWEGVPAESDPAPAPSRFVNRCSELSRLHEILQHVRAGRRQLVFVSGEPGIGKTTLVDAFLSHVQYSAPIVARGQCIEHYGEGEPFLCVIDALSRIGRSHARELLPILRRRAPAWLLMIPGLVDVRKRAAIQREVSGATAQHALTALVEAVETLAERRPLIFFFEDLQWSDHSSIDFLARLALRQEPARLMVIASYRPMDVIQQSHPIRSLVRDLAAKGLCQQIELEYFSDEAANDLIADRLGSEALPDRLSEWVQRRTEGNPLFIVGLTQYLVSEGILRQSKPDGAWTLEEQLDEVGIPASLEAVIQRDVEALDPEQRWIVEAGSVAGESFDTDVVAGATQLPAERVELCCAELARKGLLLEEDGVRPLADGSSASVYRFRHALQQSVLYEGIAQAQRCKLHQAIADRIEVAHAADTSEAAARLAAHLQRAGAVERSASWHHVAAERAARRYSLLEAVRHARQGISLLHGLPGNAERTQLEISLQLDLAKGWTLMKTWAASEAVDAFTRALELARPNPPTPQLFHALLGSYIGHLVRAELADAYGIARELRNHALELRMSRFLLAQASLPLARVLFCTGRLRESLEVFEEAYSVYKAEPAAELFEILGEALEVDLALECIVELSWVEMALGFPDRALRHAHEALDRARTVQHPRLSRWRKQRQRALSLAYAGAGLARIHRLRDEPELAERRADEAIATSSAASLGVWQEISRILRAQAEVDRGEAQGAVPRLESAIAAVHATGARLTSSLLFAGLAEGHLVLGRPEDALKACENGLLHCATTGERLGLSDLYCARSRARQALGDLAAAEADLRQAISAAREDGARWSELRSAVALVRLLPADGDDARRAREELSVLHRGFGEGAETRLLREAGALLAQHL